LQGVIAGYGIAIPVGPIGILILELGIRRGFSTAFSAGAGTATADLIYATIASTAGAFLISILAPYAHAIRVVSAIVLIAFGVWLLYNGLHGRKESKDVSGTSHAETYFMFLGLTLLNPVTVAYFTTLILGLTAGTIASSVDMLLFIGGAFSASFSWQTLLALISGSAHKRLSPKLQFVTFAFGNCLVILLGILILIGISI
jgi:arginine exporter protein ArgO